jgi:hypothetical protein
MAETASQFSPVYFLIQTLYNIQREITNGDARSLSQIITVTINYLITFSFYLHSHNRGSNLFTMTAVKSLNGGSCSFVCLQPPLATKM